MNQSPISLPRLGLIYLGFYLGMLVLVMLLFWALEYFFQFGSGNNSMGLIVPMLAAMQVGTIWYNRTGARPAGAVTWKASALFAAITFVVSGLLAVLLYSNGLLPELNGILNDTDGVMILAGIAAFMFVLVLLLCKGGLYWGARQAEKIQQRQNAKSAK